MASKEEGDLTPTTSVSLWIRLFEGTSQNEGKLFANGIAQLPISVSVACGDARVVDIGVALKTTAGNLYPNDPSLAYPMPGDLKAKKVTSENNREWKSYPDQQILDYTDDVIPSSTQVFLLTSTSVFSTVGTTKHYQLMGWVSLENYIPKTGAEPESITLYTCMDATNSGGETLTNNQYIGVSLVGKPRPEFDVRNFSLANWGCSNMDASKGTIYQIYADYGEYNNQFSFERKSMYYSAYHNDEKRDWEQPPYIEPTHNYNIFEIGFKGETGGINNIARALTHGTEESETIKQVLHHQGECTYKFEKDSALISLSAFYLKNAGIENNNARDAWIDDEARLSVTDQYGGKSEIRVYPNLKIGNDGYAYLNTKTFYIAR